MELDKDFNEFVELFIAHDVQFLIIGGYALAAHGLPRATGDLDAWVWATETNATKIITALNAFGFADVGISVGDFSKSRNDLIINKTAVGRPQDIADVQRLTQ